VKYLIGKSNIAHTRSIMVTEWYDRAKPNDGFFFIDSDHTFTADDILRVVNLQGDIHAGIYANKARMPTSFPLAGGFDERAENIPLKYAGTGFMFFRRPAIQRIYEWMKTVEGIDRVTISDIPGSNEYAVIPLFNEVIEPPRPSGQRFWLGEDFSFCWRAGQAGLKLMGCISHTLGHEIPFLVYNDTPRRGPKAWPPNSIVIYCGAKPLPPADHLDILSLVSKGYIITIFSTDPVLEEGPVQFKRMEEFHAADAFDTVILDQDSLSILDSLGGNSRRIIIQFTKLVDTLPYSIRRATKIRFSDSAVEDRFKSIIPDSIRCNGKLSEIL
jgi:hypothetical protein